MGSSSNLVTGVNSKRRGLSSLEEPHLWKGVEGHGRSWKIRSSVEEHDGSTIFMVATTP